MKRGALDEDGLVDLVAAVVLRPDGVAGLVAHAEKDHGAGNLLLIEGEVLAAHLQVRLDDALVAEDFACRARDDVDHARIIDRDGHDAQVFDIGRAAHGFGRAPRDAGDLLLEAVAHGGAEGAGRALEFGGARNDVEAGARVELADRHDGGVAGIGLAGDDRLQVLRDGGAHDERVGAELRLGAVSGLAADVDLELIARGHHRPLAQRDRAGGIVGPDVHAEAGVDALERAFLDHGARAQTQLLGGLEGEDDRALETVPDFVDDHCGREQHRDVAVVPAGVHDARNLARVGKSGLLVDGERVDVAAKKDRAAGLSALDAGERARAEAAGTPRDACAVELGADAFGSADFLRAFFGVLVEPAAHFDLIPVPAGHEFLECHFLVLSRVFRRRSRAEALRLNEKRFEVFRQKSLTKKPARMTEVIVTVTKPPTIIGGKSRLMRKSTSALSAPSSWQMRSVMIASKGKP